MFGAVLCEGKMEVCRENGILWEENRIARKRCGWKK